MRGVRRHVGICWAFLILWVGLLQWGGYLQVLPLPPAVRFVGEAVVPPNDLYVPIAIRPLECEGGGAAAEFELTHKYRGPYIVEILVDKASPVAGGAIAVLECADGAGKVRAAYDVVEAPEVFRKNVRTLAMMRAYRVPEDMPLGVPMRCELRVEPFCVPERCARECAGVVRIARRSEK